MPTYEYACKSCGNLWEEFQKISEPATTVCPKCQQTTAERQISAGNFILKGGGWYADLYSSAKPSATTSESKPEKKSEGGAEKAASKDTAATAAPTTAAPAAAPAPAKPSKSD